MASSSVFMFEIITDNNEIASLIFDEIKAKEDDQSYFNIQLLSANEVDGEYIIVQNTEEIIYNSELRIFETRTFPKATVIYFNITNKILEIWGNQTNANRLIYLLSSCIKEISLNAIEISLDAIIEKIQKKRIKVSKVSFEDFLFTEDIVGSFNVDLSSYGDPFSVLIKYKDKIARMTILLPCNNDVVKASITSKGKVIIYKKRDQLDEDAINNLHYLLLK